MITYWNHWTFFVQGGQTSVHSVHLPCPPAVQRKNKYSIYFWAWKIPKLISPPRKIPYLFSGWKIPDLFRQLRYIPVPELSIYWYLCHSYSAESHSPDGYLTATPEGFKSSGHLFVYVITSVITPPSTSTSMANQFLHFCFGCLSI